MVQQLDDDEAIHRRLVELNVQEQCVKVRRLLLLNTCNSPSETAKREARTRNGMIQWAVFFTRKRCRGCFSKVGTIA